MSDPEQFALLHEIMELKEEIVGSWPDPTTAVMISVALIVGAHLLVWVLYRRDPWMMDYMLPLASIVSIALSVILVSYAMTSQHAMEGYEALCETYRALYGPLPWEVA